MLLKFHIKMDCTLSYNDANYDSDTESNFGVSVSNFILKRWKFVPVM